MRAAVSDLPYAGVKVWTTGEAESHRIPSLARRELAEWMGPDHPALPDLQEIASELVTNAIIHANAIWVRMHLISESGFWRLTITDPGNSGETPRVRQPRPNEAGGHGLLVVDALTNGQWDTHRSLAGERVVRALLPR
ncbi:ATP-binding protein [Nonomuraea sp. NPDC026600]|uniref:ATP-binding protein n=1 Tax=Nonomuraea sp. NPDC026600 TaxID=3155363 RepID=UPI0033EBB63A